MTFHNLDEADGEPGELQDPPSIRAEYERLGPDLYYRLHGGQYRNPHEASIERALRAANEKFPADLAHVLDLAAGSGEATLVLQSLGAGCVDAIDPYTHEAYERRIGRAAERLTFEAIAAGALADRRYTLIVCSFALHLCDESRLPGLATQLALIAPQLWLLTPHKRPRLQASWGWELTGEFVVERVRFRDYRSNLMMVE